MWILGCNAWTMSGGFNFGNKLRKLVTKHNNHYNHYIGLCVYEYLDLIPKGLNCSKPASIGDVGNEFLCDWSNTLSTTNKLLQTLLKDEHLRLAREYEKQFWNQFPDAIRSSDEKSLKSWFMSVLAILERDNRNWVKVRDRKLRKQCPNYIELCTEFTPNEQSTFETDLRYVEEAFHVRHNSGNITTRSQRRKNKNRTVVSIMEDDFIVQNFNRESDNSMDNIVGSDIGQVLPEAHNFNEGIFEDQEVVLETPNIGDLLGNENILTPPEDRLEGKFVSKNVVNLSNKVLTEAEISVLSKGLKFCPTAKEIDRAKIKDDLEQFGRRLRLKWFYRNEEDDFSMNPFRKKSNFNPKQDVAIEIYLSVIEQQIMDIQEEGQNFSNLSKDEQLALKSLQNDKTIIIKSADKGSGVVVWDREDYLKEANSQLSDQNIYEKVDYDPSSELLNKISKCIGKIKDRQEMDPVTLQFFEVDNPKLGRFYLLPKIHKRLKKVPGRPVISNSGYFTENISAYLDYHLQPLAKEVKSYIKDTNDFLKKIRDLPDLPDNAILCTVDVVGLYPNIPHKDGLEALRKSLESRQNPEVSTDTLMELAELVLNNNFFTHNDDTYKQKSGTAIGTKFAPSYAILTLGDFEEDALTGATLKPWLWWRYIDDIFLIWEHGEESLLEFIDYLNNLHPTLKFTYKYSRESIEFLDVLVMREGAGIKTDLFVKETDTHQYLEFSSCHTFHTKKGIPYGQALRIRRIVSDDRVFDTRCGELKEWLMDRGYPERLVEEQIGRAKLEDRNGLLDRNRFNRKNDRDVLVLSYHPCLSKNVHSIVRNAHPILQVDAEHRRVFSEVPMVSYRRAKSLCDILVRARVPKEQVPSEWGCKGCNGRSDCQVCQAITSDTHFSSNVTGQTYEIRGGPFHCNSKNVVYLMECRKCSIQYVGSSGSNKKDSDNRMRCRYNDYKSKHREFLRRRDNGTLGKGTAVPQTALHAHFAQPDHNGIQDMSFKIIDCARNLTEIKKRESFWQYKLKTFLPNGLNDRNVDTW